MRSVTIYYTNGNNVTWTKAIGGKANIVWRKGKNITKKGTSEWDLVNGIISDARRNPFVSDIVKD